MPQYESESLDHYINRIAGEMGYPTLTPEAIELVKQSLTKPKKKRKKSRK